jgi:hypothetical protein
MTQQSLRRTIASALVVAIAALTGVAAAGSQSKGRFKKQGSNCVWAANDSGPDQCTPAGALKGRFKKQGNTCVWDPQGSGSNQCRPTTGRFKKQTAGCVWDPKDGGPDQCDPRKPAR